MSRRPLQARAAAEPLGKAPAPVALDTDRWATGRSIGDRLHQELPGFGQLIDHAHFAVISVGRRFHSATPEVAPLRIIGQVINDFNDLLFDLYDARGRPATRTARALIEHLINLSDVASSDALAERYLAHAALMPLIEADAEVGLTLLKGRDQRAEKHRLKSLARRHKTNADAAIAKYGSSFRRSWADGNLYDRARRHGLEKYYHYYRLSSHILHGAAGGAKGTVQEIGDRSIHRSGPALGLLPFAYCEGVQAFKDILEVVTDVTPSVDVTEARQATGALLAAWPAYRRAISKVDHWLWPDSAPVGPCAVLGISRAGKRRWFCHEPELGLIVEAQVPDSSEFGPGQLEGIEQLIAGISEKMFASEDQWLTITVAGVTANPRPGARWINAAAVLVPDSFGRRLPEPLIVDPSDLPWAVAACGARWSPPKDSIDR